MASNPTDPIFQMDRRLAALEKRHDALEQTSMEARASSRAKSEECRRHVEALATTVGLHDRDINDLQRDLEGLDKDLGRDGWVTTRLDGQDTKLNRIFAGILTLLVSILTLLLTIIFTALRNGG